MCWLSNVPEECEKEGELDGVEDASGRGADREELRCRRNRRRPGDAAGGARRRHQRSPLERPLPHLRSPPHQTGDTSLISDAPDWFKLRL